MQTFLSQILLGVAVADALGVPVEFKSREYLKENPVTDMLEYGTHNQPKGTWSDDTSLSLCLAESILEGLDLNRLAQKFIAWKNDGYNTPHGYMFDIGGTTRASIGRMEDGVAPELCGFSGESDNGNGSLMRILPLLALTKDLPLEERFELTKKVSSMTHSHIRSVLACHYYLEFAKKLIEEKPPKQAYLEMQSEFSDFMCQKQIGLSEREKFQRLTHNNIFDMDESEIQSSGYVIHSLEASLWCLLTTDNYRDAVLKAVNLGSDTDTTAAITGGLAVLVYGEDAIPQEWKSQLVSAETLCFDAINKPKDVYICLGSKDLIMRKIIVLSGLLVLTACKKEQAPAEVAAPSYDQLKSAEWMLGSWGNNSEQGNFSEYWTMENDSTYQGKSFVVVQNDTVFAERAILSQKGEDVFYSVLILTDSTDTETPFKLTSSSENTLVFENAENPFPKKITYTRINNDSIFAEISGGGEPQGFPMKRVK